MTRSFDDDAPVKPPYEDPPEPNQYEVGYGNPPKQSQFKRGQSGNPKGRPRGSKNRKAIVKEVAYEMHTVNEDGRRQRRSTLELVLLMVRKLAAEGNVRAFRAVNQMLAKYAPQPARGVGVMVAPARISDEDWDLWQEELNKTRTKPPPPISADMLIDEVD